MATFAIWLTVSVWPSSTAARMSATDPKPDAMESELVERVNAIRGQHQRSPLGVDETLARVAREYSCELARRGALSHTDSGGQSVGDRVRASGKNYRVVGENLATNTNARDPVGAAVDGWMRSKGHRENILRPEFTETGVGMCRNGDTYYFTQVFLHPAEAKR